MNGKIFPAPKVIFINLTCNYIHKHFQFVPFHTCNGDVIIDEARESPAGGNKAALTDVEHH